MAKSKAARIKELEAIIGARVVSEANGATPRYDEDGKLIEDIMTCETCGTSWNNALISDRTPTPSARCPYEYEHEALAELKRLKRGSREGATQKQKEKALERAANAQQRYWDALSGLEKALGFVMDDVSDLGELDAYSVADLEEKYGDGEEEICDCGRPERECAVDAGANYHADLDDWRKYGRPNTWKAFEAKHFPADPVERMYTEAFEGETDNDRAKQ